MKDIRERLIEAFQIEYREHLDVIRRLLDGGGRQDDGGTDHLDEIFRRAHSLKGAARAVDLLPVEQAAHRLETLFSRLRNGQCRLDPAVVATILAVLDGIEDCAAVVNGRGPVPEMGQCLADLDAILAGGTSAEQPPQVQLPVLPVSVDVEHRPLPMADDALRIRAVHLDRLLRSANALSTETKVQASLTQSLGRMDRALAEFEGHWRRLRKMVAMTARGGGTRTRGLDEVLGGAEQALRRLMTESRTSRRLHRRSSWSVRQLGADLQDEIRQVRMVPADSIFGGFRKMVRDIARDAGLQVSIQVAGLDVEADRIVLQGLKDPVMHLLRNALSHGVESPAERDGAGKPRQAEITLGFSIAGGRLAVTVEDDGRGIDLDAIRRRAVESGIMSQAAADAAERDDVTDLIFHPGFSTARAVDELAGRGMGLSVVRKAVAMMNGSVEVRPRQPWGTCFLLAVPLSVSSQRLILVRCRDHVYAIPTEGVDRLHRIRSAEVATVEGKSVVYLGGQQLPLLSLLHLLGFGESAVAVSRDIIPVLVLRNGERRVAVAVDALLSIRDGLVKDIGLPGSRGSVVAGGILLDNGGVALVLNPFEIVETFRKSGSLRALTVVERPTERKPPVILVVDDSLTTRTLEKSILEAQGYQVRLAFDGVEALARLRAETVDLVIADVQMPRLDGFGLLGAIKSDPVLRSTPVILVTSLEKREDREKGLGLGADAYVVKRKFDQKDLLETIGLFL